MDRAGIKDIAVEGMTMLYEQAADNRAGSGNAFRFRSSETVGRFAARHGCADRRPAVIRELVASPIGPSLSRTRRMTDLTRRPATPLRALYDWTLGLAAHRHALTALAFIAFIESSIFPIPPDVLLIPMVLAARERAWRIATVCTAASVLGGGAGYAIGLFLFDTLGRWLLEIYGYMAQFDEFRNIYNEWGWWIVLMAGVTPFPYKVITIASGVTQLDFATFMGASVVARGARFFLLAALLWQFGPPIRAFIERRLGLITIIGFALLLGGFLAVKFVI